MPAKSIANPAPSKVVASTARCTQLLLEADLPFEALQYVIDNSDFRERLITFWMNKGKHAEVEESDPHKEAREIMGHNFIGLPEIAKFMGPVEEEYVRRLAHIPFTRKTLRECAKTHVLIADEDCFHLDQMHQNYQNRFTARVQVFGSLRDIRLAGSGGYGHWMLIKKSAIKGSRGESYRMQKELIGENETMPTVRQLVHMVVMFSLSKRQWLFRDCAVRCQDIPYFSANIYVPSDKMRHSKWNKLTKHKQLGMASMRKPDARP